MRNINTYYLVIYIFYIILFNTGNLKTKVGIVIEPHHFRVYFLGGILLVSDDLIFQV